MIVQGHFSANRSRSQQPQSMNSVTPRVIRSGLFPDQLPPKIDAATSGAASATYCVYDPQISTVSKCRSRSKLAQERTWHRFLGFFGALSMETHRDDRDIGNCPLWAQRQIVGSRIFSGSGVLWAPVSSGHGEAILLIIVRHGHSARSRRSPQHITARLGGAFGPRVRRCSPITIYAERVMVMTLEAPST